MRISVYKVSYRIQLFSSYSIQLLYDAIKTTELSSIKWQDDCERQIGLDVENVVVAYFEVYRNEEHHGELHNSYSSPDIIGQIKSRRMRWAGHVARMGEGRNVYRVLVGKPEGKRPPERPRRRWEDVIKMDLRENGWGCVEWIHLAQDRDRWRAVVNAVMNLRVVAPRT
jgi:hypothetical protein